MLEVVAKAEVPEHFEERVVVGGTSHVIDIAGAEAFLASRRAGEFEFDLSEEVILELVHAGGGEQYRGVPSGDEDVAGLAVVPFGLEEGQILFA